MKTEEVEKTRRVVSIADREAQQERPGTGMTVERYLRIIAGAFVVISSAFGYWVSAYWYLFTAFVGLNLFQSGFTNWCPMMAILRKAGVRS